MDKAGQASVLYESKALAPVMGGFRLNGIDSDQRRNLLVAKMDEGKILRFPLDRPEAYTEVELPVSLQGPDGRYLKNNNELVVVANAGGQATGKVYTLRTSNRWESASLRHEFTTLVDVFLTTATIRNSST